MRLILAMILATAVATATIAQTPVPGEHVSGVPGAAFSGFKTYWLQKRDGCQPMISFNVKNASAADIGPIELHMEVVDQDKNTVFAGGLASLSSGELPPGRGKNIVIGGDHDITAHECLGDMHEAPLSGIHFIVVLSAKVDQHAASAAIVRNEPMTDEVVPAQD